jgi:DNA-binding transcriptional regulator YdaS (Cro superfamily)
VTPEFKKCVIAAGGSQKQLAEILGISEQAVGKWKNKKIPVLRVLDIERNLGVSKCELRPDIYPPDIFKNVA